MTASLHRWKQIAERQNEKIEGMSRDYNDGGDLPGDEWKNQNPGRN
jgi:hypothetical protein